jgi:integrase
MAVDVPVGDGPGGRSIAVKEPDWEFLAGHGFDVQRDSLCFPLGEDWHSYRKCRNPFCERPADRAPWLCHRCRPAFDCSGNTDLEGWLASAAGPPERRRYRQRTCEVGCDRRADSRGLCKSCNGRRLKAGMSLEEFLASSPRPSPGLGTCRVGVCDRRAEFDRNRLCGSHARRWVSAGRPDLASWAATAPPIYTDADEAVLTGLPRLCRQQVLRGYELQLREGTRLSPAQVKSAVLWLRAHDISDLTLDAVPPKGRATTYLRTWRTLLAGDGATPETEISRQVIRIEHLGAHYRPGSGTVFLADVRAGWLVELAQREVESLVALGVSHSLLKQAGHSVRWFDLFLQQQLTESLARPAGIGRPGVVQFLEWLDQRAADSATYFGLADGDPLRAVVGDRLLPAASPNGQHTDTGRRMGVTDYNRCGILRRLKDMLDRHRDWLVAHGAGDLYLNDSDIPTWPAPVHTRAEDEGRSQDALPETVFLQLLRPENLDLLADGSQRNCVELTARLGRRPWEIRHLRFDCVEWHDLTIEHPGRSSESRRYPFLIYWMHKVHRRHVLPIHDSDVTVIERQHAWLRQERPEFFDQARRSRSPELLLFPTTRRERRNTDGTHPYEASTLPYWLNTWTEKLPPLFDDHGQVFDTRRIFAYAFRHTYAQLRADAGVALDVLQELMGHDEPSTTQVYYRVSTNRRATAVAEIAARYRFDSGGDPIRSQTPAEADAARLRAGVSSVPVPAGACHEMNNVRADGHGCPIFYRCFSCTFFTTDFTHLGELRQLRADKAEQLARLEAGYGALFRAGPLADANLNLLRQEIAQLAELITKCESDIASLTDDERDRVERWLASKERYDVLIPVAAVRARRRQLDQPTIDPITLPDRPAVEGDPR